MAEIERLTPPDDPPDGGASDPAPGTTSDTPSSRSANGTSNDTGKEGIQALALRKMMGVDRTAIPTIGPGTALVIASEIGLDFSAFPSAQHFCSWLALAPGTRISGGKNLPGKSPKAINPVGQALRMAAMAARRSQTGGGCSDAPGTAAHEGIHEAGREPRRPRKGSVGESRWTGSACPGEAQRHRLHPPRRADAADLAPQQCREVDADGALPDSGRRLCRGRADQMGRLGGPPPDAAVV